MTSFIPYNQPSEADLTLMLSNEYVFSEATKKLIYRDWYCNKSNENDEPKVAVTITLKQTQKSDNGSIQRLSDSEVIKLIRRIHISASREVFGKAAQRFKLKVFLLPAIEGGGNTGKNLHIHLSIGVPRHYDRQSFMWWLNKVLRQIPWVNEQIDIQPLLTKFDEQIWHHYITKQYIALELFEPDPLRIKEMDS